MRRRHESPIVLLGSRFLSPYIMVFGWYVIFHGHYSPGGGFQGGALLAASLLLIRVSGGRRISRKQIREFATTPLAIIGVVIYFATGLTAMLYGGMFLDYAQLPLPGLDPEWLRYYGILIIEVGIGLAVMAILVMIFDNLVKGEDYG
ncbi:MAG: sodium:proton antiporter [Bacteroidetes bacterium]|jgi:multicomponent Na+:H+ antiporter subunit B|nr:sodium:proton antiporter [Bacteroidota bacterium]PTM15465.1 MAG: sodium:proton antiporter [Bacteroidota bacterium]PTM20493.1 MAG: sodium:proton antiporter [Bacteroidota bacterium]